MKRKRGRPRKESKAEREPANKRNKTEKQNPRNIYSTKRRNIQDSNFAQFVNSESENLSFLKKN